MAGSTNSSEVILPYSIDGHSQQQAIGDHGLLAGKPDDEVDGVPSIGAGADSNGRGDSNDFAKQNDTHRRIAAAWWQTSPLCMLVVMRLVLEPLRRLMLSKFDMSSEEWEESQARKLSAAIRGNGGPLQRDYRVTVSAHNDHERECQKTVDMLFAGKPFVDTLPPHGKTVRHRNLVFRLLSRIKCSVHRKLIAVHKKLPTRLFQSIDDATLCQHPNRIPRCLRDSWSDDFIS